MKVVFDANGVVSGCGWRGEPYACLVALARRLVMAYATTATLQEARETVEELRRTDRMAHHPTPVLNWHLRAARVIEPAPLGYRRSRDPDDDPDLACALAARAAAVVTFDRDLLVLGKPSGVSMWTPGQLLQALRRPAR